MGKNRGNVSYNEALEKLLSLYTGVDETPQEVAQMIKNLDGDIKHKIYQILYSNDKIIKDIKSSKGYSFKSTNKYGFKPDNKFWNSVRKELSETAQDILEEQFVKNKIFPHGTIQKGVYKYIVKEKDSASPNYVPRSSIQKSQSKRLKEEGEDKKREREQEKNKIASPLTKEEKSIDEKIVEKTAARMARLLTLSRNFNNIFNQIAKNIPESNGKYKGEDLARKWLFKNNSEAYKHYMRSKDLRESYKRDPDIEGWLLSALNDGNAEENDIKKIYNSFTPDQKKQFSKLFQDSLAFSGASIPENLAKKMSFGLIGNSLKYNQLKEENIPDSVEEYVNNALVDFMNHPEKIPKIRLANQKPKGGNMKDKNKKEKEEERISAPEGRRILRGRFPGSSKYFNYLMAPEDIANQNLGAGDKYKIEYPKDTKKDGPENTKKSPQVFTIEQIVDSIPKSEYDKFKDTTGWYDLSAQKYIKEQTAESTEMKKEQKVEDKKQDESNTKVLQELQGIHEEMKDIAKSLTQANKNQGTTTKTTSSLENINQMSTTSFLKMKNPFGTNQKDDFSLLQMIRGLSQNQQNQYKKATSDEERAAILGMPINDFIYAKQRMQKSMFGTMAHAGAEYLANSQGWVGVTDKTKNAYHQALNEYKNNARLLGLTDEEIQKNKTIAEARNKAIFQQIFKSKLSLGATELSLGNTGEFKNISGIADLLLFDESGNAVIADYKHHGKAGVEATEVGQNLIYQQKFLDLQKAIQNSYSKKMTGDEKKRLADELGFLKVQSHDESGELVDIRERTVKEITKIFEQIIEASKVYGKIYETDSQGILRTYNIQHNKLSPEVEGALRTTELFSEEQTKSLKDQAVLETGSIQVVEYGSLLIENFNKLIKDYQESLQNVKDKQQMFNALEKEYAKNPTKDIKLLYENAKKELDEAVAQATKTGGKLPADKLALVNAQFRYPMAGSGSGSGGKSEQNIFDRLLNPFKQRFTQFMNFGIAYRGLATLRKELQRTIQNIKQLDVAMTNIRIVSGLNNQEATSLMKTYNKLANQLGVTTQAVAQSANGWLRQGYSIQESNKLIEASVKLSKLGMISSEEATRNLKI